jgi:hypothetical protein
MISVLQSVGIFFKYSPKRQIKFEKVVEKHATGQKKDGEGHHMEQSDNTDMESDDQMSDVQDPYENDPEARTNTSDSSKQILK